MNTIDHINPADLPHRRIEAWKFSSNIKPWLENKNYEASVENQNHQLIEMIKNQLPQAQVNFFNDFTGLKNIFEFSQTDAVKDFYFSTLSENQNAIEIRLPKDSKSQLSLNFDLNTNQAFQNTLLYFRLEKHAQLEYIGNITAKAESFQNLSHYFLLEDGARVSFGRVQNQDYSSAHLGYDHAILARDSHFEICSLNLGAKFSRNNIDVSIAGEGAHASVDGVYITDNERHADTYSHIHHHSAHTTSRQVYKGILSDESKGVFTGRIHVHRDAQLINSDQINKTLLLSPKAHSHSQPQLEIFADDVKCAHGSTTGQLSPEEVFYLQSRGIDSKKSSQMIARGFAYDVAYKLENTWVTNKLIEHLDKVEF